MYKHINKYHAVPPKPSLSIETHADLGIQAFRRATFTQMDEHAGNSPGTSNIGFIMEVNLEYINN